MLVRIIVALILGLGCSQVSAIEAVQGAVDEVNKTVEQCEQLYEDIRQSECTRAFLDIVGKAYIKLGVSFTERQLKFEHSQTQKKAFVLSSGFKPRPIFTIALSDAYFADGQSSWGWGLGFSYFDDYAFKQVIRRNSQDKHKDLGTYSTMNVVAVSPSLFYSWGRFDHTPKSFGKAGLGLNILHSHVRGTAYQTELTSDAACYQTASDVHSGDGGTTELRAACEQVRFEESSFGAGIKLFIAGEWKLWEVEFSISQFGQNDGDEYKFNTQEAMLSFAKKFEF